MKIHTVGYNYVKIFATPGWRNTSRDYSRQYQNLGESRRTTRCLYSCHSGGTTHIFAQQRPYE
jgi:hypothetical protein